MMSLIFLLWLCCQSVFIIQAMDVLLVMVDNRNLSTLTYNDYMKYTVPINYAYATRHKYDFAVFTFDTKSVIKQASSRYGASESDARKQQGDHTNRGWATPTKQECAIFHPGLMQFRATPWVKLPVLWNISKNGWNNKMYDHIFYLDSDFVINPKYHSRSFVDLFRDWSLPDAVTKGVPVAESTMIFFSNSPYSKRPCTGGIVVNPKNARTVGTLKEWWDHNTPVKNFEHEFEQAALWELYDRRNSMAASTTSYLHNEKQFPPCNTNFLCHLGHPWSSERIETLKKLLMGRGLDANSPNSEGLEMNTEAVEAILLSVEKNMVFMSDVMDLAQQLFDGKHAQPVP